MQIQCFTFNPFQENTYILFDETKECVIIDPGCYDAEEKQELFDFIKVHELKPVHLLNTHCHIDHVLGNHFVFTAYQLLPEIHPAEEAVLAATKDYGPQFGIYMEASPPPLLILREGNTITFGNCTLEMIHAPGHSPGSICFHHTESHTLIGGDVLFQMSIGRTDLPGGNMTSLLRSIREKLFTLDPETIVFPGHGPETSIKFEKLNNPFLLAYKDN